MIGTNWQLSPFLVILVKLSSKLGDHRKTIVHLLFELLVLIFEEVACAIKLIDLSLSLLIQPHELLFGLSFFFETGDEG